MSKKKVASRMPAPVGRPVTQRQKPATLCGVEDAARAGTTIVQPLKRKRYGFCEVQYLSDVKRGRGSRLSSENREHTRDRRACHPLIDSA
ncbi:hypothetical protein F4009_15005 [Candidatus Poribacteria bacterium]|nr:hypothetical protein [Candidatus Poribacteria bacterium]MYH83075.1 hypothetical protein [Candidatus Poribacteria bacterium]MYK95279.1 hypothetical protein [Candidatus Poribacteria bacterium]